jgi:hypothetical protein
MIDHLECENRPSATLMNQQLSTTNNALHIRNVVFSYIKPGKLATGFAASDIHQQLNHISENEVK